jgi:structural maintenance of chromosome 3 (chondroitin sulfate proteoglycan 6)
VNNLLESAGFSASNPYYIVRQSRVAEISQQKPEEIWQIIKDVAGAKVYETRSAESNKLLENANKDIKKIDESLAEIDSTLKDLESEHSELLEYQAKDKQRRALEYSILERESTEAAEGLKRIEQERGQDSEKAKDVYDAMKVVRDELRQRDREIKSHQTENVRLSSEKDQIDKVERQESIKRRAHAELTVKDLSGKLDREKQSQVINIFMVTLFMMT